MDQSTDEMTKGL